MQGDVAEDGEGAAVASTPRHRWCIITRRPHSIAFPIYKILETFFRIFSLLFFLKKYSDSLSDKLSHRDG